MDFILYAICMCVIFALITTNIFLSSQIAGETDLTCEVSTSAGGVIFGILLLKQHSLAFAAISGVFGGAFLGFLTILLANKLKIAPVLSSIIVLIAAQSFLNKIAGTSTVTITTGILTQLSFLAKFFIISIPCIIQPLKTYLLLTSEWGLLARIAGSNQLLAQTNSINIQKFKTLIFIFGNALCAMAGIGLVILTNSFSASTGTGTFVFGLASILIGEKILNKNTIGSKIISYMIGSVIYRLIIDIIPHFNILKIDKDFANVLTSCCLILFITVINSESIKMHKR